jgi:hypothetical protein
VSVIGFLAGKHSKQPVVVIDEFERIKSDEERMSFADFIKQVGDHYHSPFSHVDFVLSDGNLLGASDQGPHSPVITGNPCGVAIRPSDYQVFGPGKCTAVIQTDKADLIIGKAMIVASRSSATSGTTAFDRSISPPA